MPIDPSRIFGPGWNRSAGARIVCLPFAGGSAASFGPWRRGFDGAVQLLPVELPGRGARFAEPLVEHAEVIAAELAEALSGLPAAPLLLYGHSMGTILAYETARRLHGRAQIAGLVLTGRRAPHWPDARPARQDFSDAALIAEMRAMGGTRPEVFESPDLLSLMLPVLRADYRLVANYRPELGALLPKLPLPASVIGGEADARNPVDSLAAWGELFAGPVETAIWPGGHFFIHAHQHRLLAHLRDCLERWMSPINGA
ncbi:MULTISPECIES: alpha/beta fold hydrolase [Rhodomicrobium]|uniref:thioesterase II family protein n=1 Tax=Rhodomicrobium TaxID=1068 RepID=UPI000F7462CB|nr:MULTISPECIES: alpha/beta fold hydrolase [Rhodomicrobium]